MGHCLIDQASLVLYDAPKTGGTTLRFWLHFYFTGELPSVSARPGSDNLNKYIYGDKRFSSLIREFGYRQSRFVSYTSSGLKKVCIIRDPIERFISCFNDKIVSEGKWKKFPSMTSPNDLTGFLRDSHLLSPSFKWRLKRKIGFGNDLNGNYLGFHFSPYSFHYGVNPDYYDYIFWTSQLNTSFKHFLEETFALELPSLHTRNSSQLNDSTFLKHDTHNSDLIRDFCSDDYTSSWKRFWAH